MPPPSSRAIAKSGRKPPAIGRAAAAPAGFGRAWPPPLPPPWPTKPLSWQKRWNTSSGSIAR